MDDAVRTGWISSSGKYVKAFEEAFAEYCGVKYAVGVCNGTVALHLALTCLGIGQGDEVIIPDFTMIASAFAVCYTGAKPVFVDADEKTWNIDVNKIEEKITPQTRAIMPVHIFGNPCDMYAIQQIASKHNLFIIEDAAEAHGAEYYTKMSDVRCQIVKEPKKRIAQSKKGEAQRVLVLCPHQAKVSGVSVEALEILLPSAFSPIRTLPRAKVVWW